MVSVKNFSLGKMLPAVNAGMHVTGMRFLWGALTAVAVTYILFQKKLLPHNIAKVVSKAFFLPTFPITALMRVGNYWTKIDDTLILGCAPMGFAGHPEDLYKLGVRGVVNMCYEYSGPKDSYARLGMKQLHLPTVDHCEPELVQMKEAVAFIKYHKDRNEKVYVHCKAGHGRAASIALCWMMHENAKTPAKDVNVMLKSLRKVRGTLYQQKNVLAYKQSIDL